MRGMRCRLYRAEIDELIAALTDPALLERYGEHLQRDEQGAAEPAYQRLMQQMQVLAQRAASNGFDSVVQEDRGAADALLTDVFAVATWEHWSLPVQDEGEDDCDLDGATRGLLGADDQRGGAELYRFGDGRLALRRSREVGDDSDMREHGFGPS